MGLVHIVREHLPEVRAITIWNTLRSGYQSPILQTRSILAPFFREGQNIRRRNRRKPFLRVSCDSVLDDLLVVEDTAKNEGEGKSSVCERRMKSSNEGGVEDERFSDWRDIWRFSRGHDAPEFMEVETQSMMLRKCFNLNSPNDDACKGMSLTPIPITVFTGFLGAGKTSIILSLLPQLPKDYKVVLLKNEFGDIEGETYGRGIFISISSSIFQSTANSHNNPV